MNSFTKTSSVYGVVQLLSYKTLSGNSKNLFSKFFHFSIFSFLSSTRLGQLQIPKWSHVTSLFVRSCSMSQNGKTHFKVCLTILWRYALKGRRASQEMNIASFPEREQILWSFKRYQLQELTWKSIIFLYKRFFTAVAPPLSLPPNLRLNWTKV